MGDDAVTLADMGDETLVLTVGDREIPLRRLKVGDFAAAEQHILEQRLTLLHRDMQGKPYSEDVIAKAMSEIICKPVGTADPWASATGEAFLIHRMMQCNGQAPTLKWVKTDMPCVERKMLTRMILWAARVPKAQKDAAPLDHTTASASSS